VPVVYSPVDVPPTYPGVVVYAGAVEYSGAAV
jgi:hypothetical protein